MLRLKRGWRMASRKLWMDLLGCCWWGEGENCEGGEGCEDVPEDVGGFGGCERGVVVCGHGEVGGGGGGLPLRMIAEAHAAKEE